MAHLVLIGAGHAHMTIMAHIPDILKQGHQVTAIGPNPRHYYSGMGPGMLGGSYTEEDISFPVEEMIKSRGGTFIRGKVVRIDPDAKVVQLEDGQEIGYDVLSCNAGSAVPSSFVAEGAQDVHSVKPIENLLSGRNKILERAKEKTLRIGVVGGGPAALEVAGNAWAAARENGGKGADIRVYAGTRFMKEHPESVVKRARAQFAERGIEIIEGVRAEKVDTGSVKLSDGREFSEDLIFIAAGVKPSHIFKDSGLPTGPDGGLLVDQYLSSPKYPEIFGGGDCIYFKPEPLDKVGVYAVRENPILLHNTLAMLNNTEKKTFDPGGSYLLIFNTGDGNGILHKNGIVFDGKWAFRIKDFIDRRFMKAFQPK